MARLYRKHGIFSAAVITAALIVPAAAFAASGAATTTPPATQSSAGSSPAHMARAKHEGPEVNRVQEALNKDGANLKVDGKLGPKTRSAIEAFQRAHNLGVTGKLDERTEVALKLR